MNATLLRIWGIGVVTDYDGFSGLIQGPEGIYKFYRAFIKGDDKNIVVGNSVIFHVHPYGRVAYTVVKLKAQLNCHLNQ